MTTAKITVSLDEESKRTIEDLNERLRFYPPIVPESDEERSTLEIATKYALTKRTMVPYVLLSMASQNPSLLRQLQAVRTERDTFSGEADHLKRQVDACHERIESLQKELNVHKDNAEKWRLEWEKAVEARSKLATRTEAVRQMFVEVLPHQERNDRPTVPSEAAIRLQTRIDCEEFVEKIEALYDNPATIEALRLTLNLLAKHSPIRKDLHDRLPEFADALADNAVTNEGFAVLFGIDLESVFHEVHASNMRKADGPIVEGKRLKPKGWVGPDVVGVLRRQGWQPSSESKVDEPIPYKLGTFDSVSIGGNTIEASGEFSYESDDEIADGMCALHGPLNGGNCVRCENAQYGGSEVDPIGEEATESSSIHSPQSLFVVWTGDPNANVEALTESGRSRWKKLSDVLNGRKLEIRIDQNGNRLAPIDPRDTWSTHAIVHRSSVAAKFDGMSFIGKFKAFGKEKGRRLYIQFPTDDERVAVYETMREKGTIAELTIDGVSFGLVGISAIGKGFVKPDGKTYDVQVSFVRPVLPEEE